MASSLPSPPPNRRALAARFALGAGILTGCFLAGETLRRALGLPIPGNMLGLFLLLALLGTGVVKLRWIETAAGALLWVLPLLFLPIFVGAAEDRRFWAERGGVFSVAIIAGVLALWAFVGHLAQRLFARFPNEAIDPHPLTDAELRDSAAMVETGNADAETFGHGPEPGR